MAITFFMDSYNGVKQMIEICLNIMCMTFIATIVPKRDQYWCKLQWIERGLCYYWCANTRRGFNWFESKTDAGCKLEKFFYKVEKEKTSA